MKKNRYMPPFAEVLKVTVESALMAMSAPGNGILWGGNASENNSPDPDAKGQDGWDIW